MHRVHGGSPADQQCPLVSRQRTFKANPCSAPIPPWLLMTATAELRGGKAATHVQARLNPALGAPNTTGFAHNRNHSADGHLQCNRSSRSRSLAATTRHGHSTSQLSSGGARRPPSVLFAVPGGAKGLAVLQNGAGWTHKGSRLGVRACITQVPGHAAGPRTDEGSRRHHSLRRQLQLCTLFLLQVSVPTPSL